MQTADAPHQLSPSLALASRIVFDSIFDRLEHETLGHGHNFAGEAARQRCVVQLTVDASAALEEMRIAWAGRDAELSPDVLEAQMLHLFPFFTPRHMEDVRRFVVESPGDANACSEGPTTTPSAAAATAPVAAPDAGSQAPAES
jgi:hypothetical protein